MKKLWEINEKHQYIFKGPSVSKLKDMYFKTDFSNVPPSILENAIEKGNCIHLACEEFIKNDFFNFYNCSHENDHTKIYEKFLEKLEEVFPEDISSGYKMEFFSEKSTVNCDYGFSGTIDLYVKVKAQPNIIIDFKTNSAKKTEEWKFQLIAYHLLTKEDNVNDIQIWWYNKKTEKVEIIKYDFHEAYDKYNPIIFEMIEKYWKEN